MNITTKRLVLGVLSSLLFAVGFARAAERIDPMTHSLGAPVSRSLMDPTPPCTLPCENEN